MLTARARLTGTDLRSSRLSSGLSRQQLALLVGVDAEIVAEWESGDRAVDCEAAVRQALAASRARRSEEREEGRREAR